MTPRDPHGVRAIALAEVDALVRRAAAAADRRGGVQLVSLPFALDDVDPLSFFARSRQGDRFYWHQPSRGVSFAATGAAAIVEAKGRDRFEDVDRGIADAFARLHVPSRVAPEAGPIFVGGFGYGDDPPPSSVWQGFPAARMTLPEVLIRRDHTGSHGIVSRCIAPGADEREEAEALLSALAEAARVPEPTSAEVPDPSPDPGPAAGGWPAGAEYDVVADRHHEVYCGQVAAAVRAIEAGRFEKVVLARALEVRHPGRFDVPRFLATLARTYPSCTVFATGRGDDLFVAATPELLVRRTGVVVSACAVAGSAPRGRSPEEDAALGRALTESPKERSEHAAVVGAVRAALAGPCGRLTGPDTPELLRVEGIQHLATPLEGRVRDGIPAPSVVELAGRMHPTPAVGGLPKASAGEWIAEREGLDRGWYASPVGFVDGAGCGEFQVALRSALIRNAPGGAREPRSTARLFAGAGIVAGSVPDDELRETRLKLRALLAPLTEI